MGKASAFPEVESKHNSDQMAEMERYYLPAGQLGLLFVVRALTL